MFSLCCSMCSTMEQGAEFFRSIYPLTHLLFAEGLGGGGGVWIFLDNNLHSINQAYIPILFLMIHFKRITQPLSKNLFQYCLVSTLTRKYKAFYFQFFLSLYRSLSFTLLLLLFSILTVSFSHLVVVCCHFFIPLFFMSLSLSTIVCLPLFAISFSTFYTVMSLYLSTIVFSSSFCHFVFYLL